MLVCALQQLLTTPQPDVEVRSRGLLALGTLIEADPATARLCCDLDLTSVVAQLKEAPGATSRARALAAKVLALLWRARINPNPNPNPYPIPNPVPNPNPNPNQVLALLESAAKAANEVEADAALYG